MACRARATSRRSFCRCLRKVVSVMTCARVSMKYVTRRAVPSQVNRNSNRPPPSGRACGIRSAGMRRAEDEIRASNLDWAIFRPPSLTSKPASGTYRTAIDRNLPHGFTISRADLAACMLTLLDDPSTVYRHVAIAS